MTAARPDWMARVLDTIAEDRPKAFSTFAPPDEVDRRSAVLMLFGPSDDGETDVVLTARSRSLRAHPGQVSFPGGRVDPTDSGPVDAALREAHEEVGVVPASVDVVGPSRGSSSPPAATPSRRCSAGGRCRDL